MNYTIYRLSIADQTYIGSTTNLKQRLHSHKSNCTNPNSVKYNTQLYTFIRNNGGWENISFSPIEEIKADNKIQALIKEEYWRRQYKADLNCNQAFITPYEKQVKRKIHNDKRYTIPTIPCQCGGTYKKQHIISHNNSIKHLRYLEEQNKKINDNINEPAATA